MTVGAVIAMTVLAAGPQSVQAFPISYDVSALSSDPFTPTTLDTYTGLSPTAVLNFKLNIAPPGELSFADVVFNVSLSDGTVLSSVELLGSGNGDGPVNHGLQNAITSLDLFNTTLWSVLLGPNPGGLDILLTANAFSSDAPFANFTPMLDVDVANANVVPLPGALPLFASGISMLGWFSLRRRRPTYA